MEKQKPKMDLRVCNGKYKLMERCGSGAFGQIFYAINMKSGEEVAIKLENLNVPFP